MTARPSKEHIIAEIQRTAAENGGAPLGQDTFRAVTGIVESQVSGAVGHSSPAVTRRYYDHFIRRSFSPTLRAGLPVSGKQ